MTTNVQENKSFEQKMKERIKDSIGDLLSDEDLAKIIDKGMHETFFQAKLVTVGYQNKYDDPLIVDVLKGLVKDRVNEQVDQWLKDNPDKIQESLSKIIENGVGAAVVNAMSSKFQMELLDFQNKVERSIYS